MPREEVRTGAMVMEFHVSRAARERYGLDTSLFSLSGNVILADFRATRAFAAKMNASRDVAASPDRAIQTGQLNAMGLIDEILHYVAAMYASQENPAAMGRALRAVEDDLGREAVDAGLLAFVRQFPSAAVYRGEAAPEAWLAGASNGRSNRDIALEELLHVWLANMNTAFEPFRELFDDAALAADAPYAELVDSVGRFFATEPPFGPEGETLVALLRSPAIAEPESLSGQLRYIRQRWGFLLRGSFMDRLVVSLDVLAEDERARWLRFHGADANVDRRRGELVDFSGQELEPERFSMDRDWMPRLVLLAKSTYVWLDQLSRSYGRDIRTLDAIPDEELDRLARWGFSGLWLIGLWERSEASERIKKLRGNPEAVASAYSLLDYRIADDLGGPEACERLRARAWRRGIRLSSDMVPNHMGIDSRWVVEHPDWFLSVADSPFPSYSFNGPDLSADERVGIQIEDHYYDSTDAAVVFRRTDRWSGDVRHIYHGNDGTSMPWNDTAQLNYLMPEVREAVIQTILHVARQFPVIRFDAAMTLAKKHIQRLWFPEPGSGGAIPSRAEHGMSKAAFDDAMPVEFWREVVDRVAAEVPDTLLLAEAFWLMEGYFVRTLGMHRVYNSAFMNMLRDEENANYRLVMKNTLEFDPEILKRYVNFMNNPDERTAIEQFGNGDKYFGTCTLMATLPGLPMFGHGQVEGFGEKYGMEYRRAYRDERPDEGLVARHEREIFPLLHRRHLFAEVRDFLLYDVVDDHGRVNEDVFAYSNMAGGERSLVVYHNRYAEAAGWIRESVAYAVRTGAEGEKALIRRTIGEGLGLHDDPGWFCVLRDERTGLEFLRACSEIHERGMFVQVHAYSCQVFVGIREVSDSPEGAYARLAAELDGRGVPSIDEALREMRLRPVQEPFRRLVSGPTMRRLLAARRDAARGEPWTPDEEWMLGEIEGWARDLGAAASAIAGGGGDPASYARQVRRDVEAILGLPGLPPDVLAAETPPTRSTDGATRSGAAAGGAPAPKGRVAAGSSGTRGAADGRGSATGDAEDVGTAARRLRDAFPDDLQTWGTLLVWAAVHHLGRAVERDAGPGATDGAAATSRALLDEWGLARIAGAALLDLGLDPVSVDRAVETIRVLVSVGAPREPGTAATDGGATAAAATVTTDAAGSPDVRDAVSRWLRDEDATRYLRVNRWEGVTWFDRDAYERLLRWTFLLDVIRACAAAAITAGERRSRIAAAYRRAAGLQAACDASGYRVDRLLEVPGTPRP